MIIDRNKLVIDHRHTKYSIHPFIHEDYHGDLATILGQVGRNLSKHNYFESDRIYYSLDL